MTSRGFDPVLFQTDRHMVEATRVSTGSYYTPYSFAYWMVSTTLKSHLSSLWSTDQRGGGDGYGGSYSLWLKTHLLNFKILDPACGSGVFPCAYLACCKDIWEQEGLGLFPSADFIQNLFVCDIQKGPLDLYKQIVSDWAQVPATDIPVYLVDCLSDEDIKIQKPLLKASLEGFDFVFGNPPYLGEKSNKDLFRQVRSQTFGEKFYEGRMDYFYYFIYRGIEWLKTGGRLCFVTTNYFPTADGAVKLRSYLKEQGTFTRLINFGEAVIFKEAMGQNNLVFEYLKGDYEVRACAVWNANSKEVSLPESDTSAGWRHHLLPQDMLYDDHGCLNLYGNAEVSRLLERLQSICQSCLGDLYEVNQGIVSGADKATSTREGIFVLSEAEKKSLGVDSHRIKPLYKNKDIGKYSIRRGGDDWILYIEGTESMDEPFDDVLLNHLQAHKSRLSKRREVLSNVRPWYALQWPRIPERFEQPKLIAPQRAYVNVFAYANEPVYGSADLYYLSAKDKGLPEDNLLYTLAYLNSKIIYFWLYYAGKRKGKMLELYATPLKKMPLIRWQPECNDCRDLVGIVKQLLQGVGSRANLTASIDDHFYKRLGLTADEIMLIEDCYKLEEADRWESLYWRGGSIDTI